MLYQFTRKPSDDRYLLHPDSGIAQVSSYILHSRIAAC